MANYIKDDDLYYEIVLSKGKGFLTKKAEHYLQMIANNAIRKKLRDYKDEDEMKDCLQTGLLVLFENWKLFNEKKYNTAMPYVTEIFKRALAMGYNELHNKKPYHKTKVVMISLNNCNDGNGMHNV